MSFGPGLTAATKFFPMADKTIYRTTAALTIPDKHLPIPEVKLILDISQIQYKLHSRGEALFTNMSEN